MMKRLYDGTLIYAEGVTRGFVTGQKRVAVLRGVDLQVEAGELVALYGPSGSGKTTLLNIMGALDVPDDGIVQVLGQTLNKMRAGRRAKLRRQHIGFIFQNYSLINA